MTDKKRHVHKMKRTDIGKKRPYIVYKCTDPFCTWYQIPELAVGKATICWACGREMVLTSDRLIARPTCCTRKVDQIVNDPEIEEIQNMLLGRDDE